LTETAGLTYKDDFYSILFPLFSSPVAVVLSWFDPRFADAHEVWGVVTAAASTRGGEGGAAAAAPPTAPPTPRHKGEGGAAAPLLLLTAGSVGMVAGAPLHQGNSFMKLEIKGIETRDVHRFEEMFGEFDQLNQ